MSAMLLDLPYLLSDPDRHGNPRLYVRRHGKRIRIKELPSTPAFLEAYNAAVEALERPTDVALREAASTPTKGTVGWLVTSYFRESGEYKALVEKSRQARRACIEACLLEPLKPGSKLLIRDVPIGRFGPVHVKLLRDRKSHLPGAANNRRKHLSALCSWAAEHGLMQANPVRDVKMARRNKVGGYHTWTVEEVHRFVQRHPVGTKACLALALMLFTGARRQDMVHFGKQHVRDGWLRYVPKKTLYKRNTVSQKPWLPELDAIVRESPCGDMTYLVTKHGRPFTANGIGNKFREWADQAGLPHCTAHGLKKAGATLAAEAGATALQLMAIFDWSTLNQAKPYTDAADRKRMAGEAMGMLAEQPANIFVSHRSVAPQKSIENQ
jgi:integrase